MRGADCEVEVAPRELPAPRIPESETTFISLCTFDFAEGKSAAVVVTNAGADGYVIVDAVQWLEAKARGAVNYDASPVLRSKFHFALAHNVLNY